MLLRLHLLMRFPEQPSMNSQNKNYLPKDFEWHIKPIKLKGYAVPGLFNLTS